MACAVVKQELDCARRIFRDHPGWPVIDVTGRAIEETAVIILESLKERDEARTPKNGGHRLRVRCTLCAEKARGGTRRAARRRSARGGRRARRPGRVLAPCSRVAREPRPRSRRLRPRRPSRRRPASSASAQPGAAPPRPRAVTPETCSSSPRRSTRCAGARFRVVALSDRPVDAHLTVTGAGPAASTPERHGGPPYFWMQRIEAPASGKWTATLTRDEACGGADNTLATRVVTVRAQSPAIPDSPLTRRSGRRAPRGRPRLREPLFGVDRVDVRGARSTRR